MKASIVIASLLLTGCNQKSFAEAEARQYIAQMFHGEPASVSCMPYDSDNNGYVSCDAIVAGHQVALECAAERGCPAWCNEGCKLRSVLQPGTSAP